MPNKNGEWWNGGWQRRKKGSWDGEKSLASEKNDNGDNGSVTLIKKPEGFWVDGSQLAEEKTKKMTIKITTLNNENVFVRVTRSNEDGVNCFPPIEHTNEEASLKAFNMELGGAKHLFSVYDGLTYPSQRIDGFYNFVSDEIYEAMCWLNGKNKAGVIKIELADFPGHLGCRAARGEYRNISRFSITKEDALSIPVWIVQGIFHKILKSNERVIRNQYTGRAVIFELDFTSVFRDIVITGRDTEMLTKEDVSRFLKEKFKDESEPTSSIKRKFSEET